MMIFSISKSLPMPGLLNKWVVLTFILLSILIIPVYSQSTDFELIKNCSFVNPKFEKHKARPFLKSNSGSFLVKYNPVRLTFGGMLYIYQNVLSAQYSAQCLYNPSCSAFGKQLIYDYGLIPGIFYTADRIMRCNRLAEHDLHESQIDESDHRVHESTGIYRSEK